MKIDKFMKIFSVEMRLKLLSHFYTCNCRNHCVTDLVSKFGTTQANISKHLLSMKKWGVLNHSSEKKIKNYYLHEDFKKEWNDLIISIISNDEMKKHYCRCSNK